MSDKIFADGMYFNTKRDNAPDFVLGSSSIKPDQFIEWLKQQKTNQNGYVNIDFLMSKGGKPYCQLNTYGVEKSEEKQTEKVKTNVVVEPNTVEYPTEEINPEDIPF